MVSFPRRRSHQGRDLEDLQQQPKLRGNKTGLGGREDAGLRDGGEL